MARDWEIGSRVIVRAVIQRPHADTVAVSPVGGVSTIHEPRDIHVPHCTLDCGGSYVCPACDRICGWCFGAHDEMPAVCDDCWFRIDAGEDECPSCHGEGSNDGRFCSCPAGRAEFQREYAAHAWMAGYARQANAMERLGDHESAEAIRKMVCS